MFVGYARVSTIDQTLDLQRDALSVAGCTKIFTDTASGAQAEREGLTEAISYVRAGDTLVVWKLDRLGRSLKDLIERITQLNDRNIGFRSITENIDTTTCISRHRSSCDKELSNRLNRRRVVPRKHREVDGASRDRAHGSLDRAAQGRWKPDAAAVAR